MNIAYLGIDLAKNVFQLHGVDHKNHAVLRTRIRRAQLIESVSKIEPCIIGVEACTGAFYWQRRFQELGHTVKIVSPQYVRPFVRRQKNDGNDAEAICTAIQQPDMRFVPPRSLEQQDIQALHRARQRLVNHRTAVVCQMRGLLLDRGFAIGPGVKRVRRVVPEILEDAENDLSHLARESIAELFDLLRDLDRRVAGFDQRIEAIFEQSELCQRIAPIKGVGPKTATAIVAAIGDGAEFKNGRHFAAWLGLVPRQHSSGDRSRLMGISKQGDQYLRTLLIHGARAVVRTAANRTDPLNTWVNQLRERRGFNKATVAVANKNARIIWAVLHHREEYRRAA